MNLTHYLKAKYVHQDCINTRKTLEVKLNGRSADYIIPSFQLGCSCACAYCYVARHRSYGNPITTYTNLEEIKRAVSNHYYSLRFPKQSNQTHSQYYTYDIGESTDCLSPEVINNTNDVIKFFLSNLKYALPTFATKLPINHPNLIDISNIGLRRARVRISLSPTEILNIVEPGTNSLSHRLQSIPYLYNKGYEIHINLSPVIIYPNWEKHYSKLLLTIHSILSNYPEIEKQIKFEVIFLTHHSKLNKANLEWNPEAEDILWRPDIQEIKRLDGTVRYKLPIKSKAVSFITKLINHFYPNSIRYIF